MMAFLAMTAIGVVLGLRFKIFVLVPAFVISAVGSLAIAVEHGSGIWPNLLAIFSVIAELQIGYIAGSVASFAITGGRDRKHQSDMVTVAQRR